MPAEVSSLVLAFTTLILAGFALQVFVLYKRRGEFIVYKPVFLLVVCALWIVSGVSVITGRSISELTGGVIG